jgi:hypothetical protein
VHSGFYSANVAVYLFESEPQPQPRPTQQPSSDHEVIDLDVTDAATGSTAPALASSNNASSRTLLWASAHAIKLNHKKFLSVVDETGRAVTMSKDEVWHSPTRTHPSISLHQ